MTGQRGTTRQRGNRWQARYRDPGGTERSRTFRLERDAKGWLNKRLADQESGKATDHDRGRRKFDEWADDYLATTPHLSEKTKTGHTSLMRTHILPAFGSWPVVTINRSHVRTWVADLDATGLSGSRIRQALSLLRAVFDLAIDADAIASNPAIGVKTPTARSKEMLFLEPHQVAELAATIDPHFSTAVTFAAFTGLRAGEIWALRPASIDIDARTVRVNRAVSDVAGKRVEGPTKTKRDRTVPLPQFVADLLKQHLQHDSFYAFPAPNGGQVLHSNFYRRAFRPAVLEASGVPDGLRFHDLRHTCAAMLIAEGAHHRAIMEWLGHSTAQISLDRYGHLMPAITTELAGRLDTVGRDLVWSQRGQDTKEPLAKHPRWGSDQGL